jgi:signal transduction histidine kinase
LLNFSRIGASEVEKVKVDLNDLVSDSLSEYQHMIEATEGGFQVAHLPVVAGTPFQIRQLFNNLISNSIKFARKGIPLQIQIDNELVNGSLEENLSFEKPYWKVSFKDNGIGFQPEFSEKIFEVFQRLHTQGTYEGTGIGLAICKRIMEHHNGFIKATSTLGKGATFELYFPLYEE